MHDEMLTIQFTAFVLSEILLEYAVLPELFIKKKQKKSM